MINIWDNEKIAKTIHEGGVVVMPTDTIYGIIGSALNQSTVERIYEIRKREKEKPCIVLIGNTMELKKFNIELSLKQEAVIKNYWPGSVSIILDCDQEQLSYLHRGTKALAFRLPKEKGLQNLLEKTGPVIAPSANIAGMPPAKNISQANEYFVNLIDLYIDGGEIEGKPSKLIRLHKDGAVSILRE